MKSLLKIVLLCLTLCISACVTNSPQVASINSDLSKLPIPLKLQTPSQLATNICPVLQAELPIVSAAGFADPNITAQLAIAIPIINTVCSAGETVNAADLQSLAQTGVPSLIKVVQASTLSADQKQQAVLSIGLANAVLEPIVQQIQAQIQIPK